MKKLLSTLFVLSLILTSCGPAAEDRVAMDKLAKRMSDSLAHLIDSAMNDPLKYVNLKAPSVPVFQPTTTAQPTSVPTKTK